MDVLVVRVGVKDYHKLVAGRVEPDIPHMRVRDLVGGREPLLLGATDVEVRRLAVCSGGSASSIEEAAAIGCDALLTGEPREDSAALGRELGVALIAAGHHATERYGVQALGDYLARRFALEHLFIDCPNPI